MDISVTVISGYVATFFRDVRVAAIIALILVDVLLALAVAIRDKIFEGRRLAEYMRTMVVPYILGYLALYLASKGLAWAAAQTGADLAVWLGPVATVFSEGTIMLAWLTLMGNLGADVLRQLKALRYPFAGSLDIPPGVGDETAAGAAPVTRSGVVKSDARTSTTRRFN